MSANYNIGQVLFIIPSNVAGVVPVQVIERRVSETLDGTTIQHVIRVPKKESKPKVLETIKGTVYLSLADAQASMVDNAKKGIASIIKKTSAVALRAFGGTTQEAIEHDGLSIDDIGEETDAQMSLPMIPVNDNMTEIMLPDGSTTNAKVNIIS